jgi:hypothetical protein
MKCGVSREQYWSECSDSEKIKRCRYHIKDLQYTVELLAEAIHRLTFHEHLNGKLLTSMDVDVYF